MCADHLCGTSLIDRMSKLCVVVFSSSLSTPPALAPGGSTRISLLEVG
jgi:hypothetical protein